MSGSTSPILKALCRTALLFFLAAFPARGETPCREASRSDRLESLTPEGDLVLAEGRLAKLAGIRLPDTPDRRDKALVFLRGKTGQSVLVQAGEKRDRWNRVAARISPTETSRSLDLAHDLVAEGLALVDFTVSDPSCGPDLLAAEDMARKRSLGLWADDRYKPLQADQTELLQSRVGRFTLVEGRVHSVGERSKTTYLNFGGHWADDFTIIIPQKTWKLMADRGLTAETLKGSRIRVRGILQSWQGTAISIVIPEAIERLDGRRAR